MFNQRYGSHEINNDAGPREHGHLGLRTGTAGTEVNLHGKDLLHSYKESNGHGQGHQD